MNARKEARAARAKARQSCLQRACGNCVACCTTLGVKELDKKAGERCMHLVEGQKGCSVYKTRPQSCQEWSCLWRHGAFEGADRPDRIGVVMDVTGVSEAWPDGQVLIAREAFPGGYERAATFLNILAHRTVVVCILADGNRRVLTIDPAKRAHVEAAIKRFLPVVS